jgi:hypothetical protein
LRINVIATPSASRENHHYICVTNQEAPHVFIPQEARNPVCR